MAVSALGILEGIVLGLFIVIALVFFGFIIVALLSKEWFWFMGSSVVILGLASVGLFAMDDGMQSLKEMVKSKSD